MMASNNESFTVEAHRKKAFRNLAMVMVFAVVLNLLLIGTADQQFHFLENWLSELSLLVIPIFFLLLLPTLLVFLLFNGTLTKKYEVDFNQNGFHFNLHKKNNVTNYDFNWKEITGYRFIDFEDNHYFAFEVNGVKSDLILHRNKYDFDSFLEIFLKQTALPINKE